ncbi:HD domain-containing protein [Bacillus horti]|uniref:HD superfamily phosphohydrolase n=1 Tax=Caldalkalibacillus horti TaxID=77523 RepID=A0ABT9W295_9BACI|nr:HD domain-containing protein [Bacillus horti]MDQ0167351.1 HD superfamily phosphohydrolase [Bacillus horti]
MNTSDVLYGHFTVEPVLEELIQSKPVQRLKGIHQGGASYLVNPTWSVTRYEHSIGVMLLIRKLGGSLEEQIAGLLHDISHTAFSHVIDFVLKNEAEDYHEEIFHSVLTASEIPQMLNRHGYDYKELLLDDSKWTLLEQSAPELCADRIDYTLRDLYTYGHITMAEVQTFLDHLTIIEGKIYLDNLQAAEWFVEAYYKEVIDFFMDPLNIYGYAQLADTLKLALEKKWLYLEDLLETDEVVMNRLRSIQDTNLQAMLERLNNQVKVVEDEVDYEIHRKNKLRLIDPSVLQGDQLVPASTLSENVKEMGDQAYQKASKGTFVRVI